MEFAVRKEIEPASSWTFFLEITNKLCHFCFSFSKELSKAIFLGNQAKFNLVLHIILQNKEVTFVAHEA